MPSRPLFYSPELPSDSRHVGDQLIDGLAFHGKRIRGGCVFFPNDIELNHLNQRLPDRLHRNGGVPSPAAHPSL